MKIEVSSNVPISEKFIEKITGLVESGLDHFQERLTRAEVHVRNIEGSASGAPPECRLEVRPASQEPVAVSHEASTTEEAVKGAAEKMYRLLSSRFGKQDAKSGGPSASGNAT